MKAFIQIALLSLLVAGCNYNPSTKPIPPQYICSSTAKANLSKPREVRNVVFSTEGKFLAVAKVNTDALGNATSSIIEIWNVSTQSKTASWSFATPITKLAFLTQRGLLATLSGNGLEMWDLKSKRLHHRLKANSNSAFGAVAISPDEQWVALGGEVWDTSNWRKRAHFDGIYHSVIKANAFSPDGAVLVIGSYDVTNGTEARRIRDGRRLWIGMGDHSYDDLAYSPNGTYVSVCYYGGLLLLNAANGRLVKKLSKARDGQVVFSRGGNSLLHVTEDEIIQYQLQSGKIVQRTRIKKADFTVLSPDGRTYVQISNNSKKVQFRTL